MRPSRMLARNWRHQWLPLCLSKFFRTIRIVGVVHPIKSNQDLRVFWKLMNLQDCVWENHYQIIMKTILQEKETIHYSITIWFTNLFLCLKPWRFLQQRQRWTRNGKNWRKFRRGTWPKSKVRKRWSMKQGCLALQFISPHWWTYVIWKMRIWRQKHQKYKGRVVLRGDIVKDDSGAYAVFSEQRSSASQMTAAKVVDIISRLPGCDGQAADAVSAYTQVKMEDAHKLFKKPKSECPDILIRLPRHNWPKSWSSMEDPVVPLERNLYGHPLAGLLWERQFEKILLQQGWEKVSNWECLFVHREKGLFLSVCVDDIKLAGKEQNIDPMWKVLNKQVDFGRTNIFPRSWIPGLHSKTMWNEQRYCGQIQSYVWIANFRAWNTKASILWEFSYFFMVLWYGRSCEEMCGAILWVGKQDDSTTLQSVYSMHRWPPLWRGRNEICWIIVTSMLTNCSEMLVLGTYWKTWYSVSVNKLARSITKWTKACDKRLNRLISKIHYTCEYKQFCHVGNTAKQCRLGLFQDSDFAGDLEGSKSTSGRTLCVFGSHTFVPISWICKKQIAVSHSSTESEMDGIPALESWDLIVIVLENTIQTTTERCNPLWTVAKVTGPASDLKESSTFWMMLTVFPQTSNFASRSFVECVWGQRSSD